MVRIYTLSELKRAMAQKTPFEITLHRVSSMRGRRTPNVIQTNGIYSVETDNPQSKLSLANHGKGSWLAYGKASDWEFKDGVCTLFQSGCSHTLESFILSLRIEEPNRVPTEAAIQKVLAMEGLPAYPIDRQPHLHRFAITVEDGEWSKDHVRLDEVIRKHLKPDCITEVETTCVDHNVYTSIHYFRFLYGR